MQWALEEGFEDEDEWSFIQMLCFRYSLVAPTEELHFLSAICLKIDAYRQASNDPYFILSLVDMDDARTVLQAYITRMTPSPSQDRVLAGFAFDDLMIEFIGQDVMLDLVDLMPRLLSVSFSWIWEQLDLDARTEGDLSQDKELIRFAIFTFDIVKRLYANARGMPAQTVSSFTKALSEGDFLNLVGRVMFMPMADGSKAGELEQDSHSDDSYDSNDPYNVTQNWSRLAESIISFSKVYAESAPATNGTLVKFYPDWVKTWNNFMLQSPRHPDPSPWLKGYTELCGMAWMMLGLVFGYSMQQEQNYRYCAYDRCFGPVCTGYAGRTCERCLVASYCSTHCQNAHWKPTAIGSHRDSCLGVEGQIS